MLNTGSAEAWYRPLIQGLSICVHILSSHVQDHIRKTGQWMINTLTTERKKAKIRNIHSRVHYSAAFREPDYHLNAKNV